MTRARAIARCARCRFGPPSRGEVLSRTSERTGRPRRGVRATRGAWGAETRDPRWNTRVHRRDDPSSADASGRDAAGSPRVRASAVGWAGTHQLARALAFALVLSEPVLGELLIALQAAQPLDRLGDVLADVARRLHGRAREKHGHLDRGCVAKRAEEWKKKRQRGTKRSEGIRAKKSTFSRSTLARFF